MFSLISTVGVQKFTEMIGKKFQEQFPTITDEEGKEMYKEYIKSSLKVENFIAKMSPGNKLQFSRQDLISELAGRLVEFETGKAIQPFLNFIATRGDALQNELLQLKKEIVIESVFDPEKPSADTLQIPYEQREIDFSAELQKIGETNYMIAPTCMHLIAYEYFEFLVFKHRSKIQEQLDTLRRKRIEVMDTDEAEYKKLFDEGDGNLIFANLKEFLELAKPFLGVDIYLKAQKTGEQGRQENNQEFWQAYMRCTSQGMKKEGEALLSFERTNELIPVFQKCQRDCLKEKMLG